jgi:hypothetical protein
MSGLRFGRIGGPVRRSRLMVLGVATSVAAGALVAVMPAAASATAAAADLSLSFVPWQRPDIYVGQSPSTIMSIQNKGPFDTPNLVVRMTIPAGLTFVSAYLYYDNAKQQLPCRTASSDLVCQSDAVIAAGTSAELEANFGPASKGSYDLAAKVSSALGDPNPSDNSATTTIRVCEAYASAFAEQTRTLASPDPALWVHASTPGESSYAYGPSFDFEPSGGLSTYSEAAYVDRYSPRAAGGWSAAAVDLEYGVIEATSVTAQCSATTTAQIGSATFESLWIYPFGTTDPTPPPNTQKTVPIGPSQYATVTLNEQAISGATITVNAIHLRVYDDLTHTLVADVVVGQALCSVTF